MPKINSNAPKLIDDFIAGSLPFAQKICRKLREIIHKADSSIIEDWKWGANFNKNGMVCGFWAFKKHVTLVFFQGALLKDHKNILQHGGTNKHNRSIKFTDIKEIDEAALIQYIKEAVKNNEKNLKVVSKKENIIIPDDLKKALIISKKASENFKKFAYTYRKEYVQWVENAKQQNTRERRVNEVVAKSFQNKKIHEKYMK